MVLADGQAFQVAQESAVGLECAFCCRRAVGHLSHHFYHHNLGTISTFSSPHLPYLTLPPPGCVCVCSFWLVASCSNVWTGSGEVHRADATVVVFWWFGYAGD